MRLGRLDVRVSGGDDGRGGGDGPVIVLLHGFGAPGTDLVPLGRLLEVPGARFVFPAAPMQLPGYFGDARAWWMIDIEGLERDLAAGTPRDRAEELPEGLAPACELVNELLDAVERELGVGGERILLGGFSQGAMLSCDVALRSQRPLAGLVLLSGTLLAAVDWLPLMPARSDLPVFQSHGRADPLLSFAAAERLRDHLREANLQVEWHAFDGGHEIPPTVLEALGGFARRALGGGQRR